MMNTKENANRAADCGLVKVVMQCFDSFSIT